jgi:hypothetical protein
VSRLVPEYPRNQAEFEAWFATEDACRAYLERLRWPDGFRCPRCREGKGWPVGRLVQCAACGRQTSVTAGTIFQDTRTPLTVWFRAMWAVTGRKTGTSALSLQHLLGLGSYQTAWAWLHKLRRAMVRPGRERLTGRVEVDETFVGALEEGATGRGAVKKVLLVVAVEYNAREIGRIRLRRVPDGSADSLQTFIDEVVEPGSVVHTDGWVGYDRVKAHGYRHRITFVSDHPEPASELLRACISSCPCSSGGCWAPIRGRSARHIWTTTWTSSRSGSTDAGRAIAACCSSASPNRPSRSTLSPTERWSGRRVEGHHRAAGAGRPNVTTTCSGLSGPT